MTMQSMCRQQGIQCRIWLLVKHKTTIRQGLGKMEVSTLFLLFELLEAKYLTNFKEDYSKVRQKQEVAKVRGQK